VIVDAGNGQTLESEPDHPLPDQISSRLDDVRISVSEAIQAANRLGAAIEVELQHHEGALLYDVRAVGPADEPVHISIDARTGAQSPRTSDSD
jgi:uncharacterized membrane protein YkoI